MSSFVIEGGRRLQGDICPFGAKNEALQVICATLLTTERVTIKNIPDILDVKNLIKLLADMGVDVERDGHDTYHFCARSLDEKYLSSHDFMTQCARLRGSVMLIGPLLARLGHVCYATAGGDKIGRRRLDTHFHGFEALGASFVYDEALHAYVFDAPRGMNGRYMLLDEASVTGTANIVMAAVLAQQLCRLLSRMGARISGIASNLLTIEGVTSLHAAEHTILPDMIEVGSFIGMAAMTGSALNIKNCSMPNLGIIPDCFRRMGLTVEQHGDDLYVPRQDHYEIESFIDGSILTMADGTWPALTPDLLSVILVVATQAKGSVLIHQKMFESRLFFVDKLIDMGAQIILCDPHRAVVIGHDHRIRLKANHMVSPDIRAGIAMLIAAMSADGVSRIDHIEQIDRGYADIEGRLNALGANIKRVDE